MARIIDRALETARQILAGQICECGCHDSEHVYHGNGPTTAPDTKRCECRGKKKCQTFQPVTFRVERA